MGKADRQTRSGQTEGLTARKARGVREKKGTDTFKGFIWQPVMM